MCGDPVPAPADAADPLASVRAALESDRCALGEPLMVIGSGPIAVEGALGALLALDSRGTAVLVAAFNVLPLGAAEDLSDELDRLSQLGPKKLGEAAASPEQGFSKAHSEYFGLSNGSAPVLNGEQKAIVVLTSPPGVAAWKDLKADLGPGLGGVFVAGSSGLVPQKLPEPLARRTRTWWFWRSIAVAAVAAGVVGFWLARAIDSPEIAQGVSGPLISSGAVVAAQVGGDATHTQWIGQRRVARTSNGFLVAAYATQDGLQVVRDQANQGRTWQVAQSIATIQPLSFALAVDGADRIHVAFRDAQGVGYAYLQDSATGLVPSEVVRVDTGTTSPVVDMAFDAQNSTAHVVWVKGETDQQPFWAGISAPAGQAPVLVRSEPLAETGNSLSVLVNVGVGPENKVVATFRRGDSLEGWFARYLDGADPANPAWAEEERLPTPEALYGAASLALDRAGNAHLVLRDNTTYGLTYLKRAQGVWSGPETIVDVETTEEIDFPSISPDLSSEVVYVFYQDTVTTGRGQIKVAVRDPATGWSTPSAAPGADALLYPTSTGSALGNSLFFATSQEAPQIRAFRAG